jgi:hypothetical protein
MTPIDISNQSTYRGGQLGQVNGFIFHHTGERGTPSDIINTLNRRGLGTQYVMDRDGQIYRTLPQGAKGAQIQNSPNSNLSNNNTEGMEIIANDDKDLTQAQIDSAKQFGQTYAQQHPGVQFYGHGMINPGHKEPTEGYTVTNEVRSALHQPTIGPGGVAPASYTPGSYTVASGDGQTQTPDDNRQAVFKALTSPEIGLNAKQALGVMWSLGGESYGSLQSGATEKPGGVGGGIGIAQWTGTRRAALEAYAQQAGKPVNDPNLQIDYLKSELLGSERASLEHLKTVGTADAAARVTTAEFLRPAVNNSEARIAQGAHVGTVDDNGNFIAGDAKVPTRTPTPTTATPATPGSPTAPTTTPTTPTTPVMTPESGFEQSIGQALAGIGKVVASAQPTEVPDQPAIRTMAMDMPGPATPNAMPGSMGNTLAQTVQGSLTDPEISITQGAPGMTSLIGAMGTPDTYNMYDPRATRSPSLTMRTPRIG